MAFGAVIAVHGSMEFVYRFAACCLMKPINILSHNSSKFAFLFHFCQFQMSDIWLGVQTDHLIAVKVIERFCISHKKRMAENGFRWIIIFLMIQTIYTAKIRDAAFG